MAVFDKTEERWPSLIRRVFCKHARDEPLINEPMNCAPTIQGMQSLPGCPSRLHLPPGCLSRLPLYRCRHSLCQSQPTADLPIAPAFAAGLPIAPAEHVCVIFEPTAELPIAPAFAAGLPIAPATIPLPALAVPIATYCRAAHRACIRRRAAYRACRTRFVLSSSLLQSCPSRLHSSTGCLLRSTWNQTIHYSRDSHENPNVLRGW